MHRASPHRFQPSTRRRGFAFVLALALVAVQMLGLAHRIVHADRMQLASTSAKSVLAGVGDPASAAQLKSAGHRGTGSWLLDLFAGHDPGHDCDAFDQMSHADIAVGMTLDAALPAAATEACTAHAAWHLAAQAQGFLARAPPSAS